MSVQDAGFEPSVHFPSNALSEVPFRVYTDPEQYRLEQVRIFKGPSWNYLCLAGEIAEPGVLLAMTAGDVALVGSRAPVLVVNGSDNRSILRVDLVCPTREVEV